MLSKLFITIIFISAYLQVHSQGFDWQYSSRYPVDAPTLFGGLSFAYNHSIHSADIDLREYFVYCCEFKEGTGNGFSVGSNFEYWQSGNYSIFLALNFKNQSASFFKTERLPRLYDTLVTQYELNNTLTSFSIETGAKHRLFKSHFHVAASLLFTYIFNTDNKYTETVLEPKDFPWHQREISTGNISGLNKFNIYPNLRIGYDWSFDLNWYATPFIQVSFPLFDMSSNKKWRSSVFEFGVILLKGIN
ncbi:MAG TPA: hypothetical protein PKY56_08135 [Candidatus Kapabacteria bacterium]|nr:hypothetical protein [Candidatus Kapabacteria bacterium]HPO63792.1 hypothetical protein [Candidatus Kapabacteria bacterium]